jgi:hypothetical protein
MDEYADLEVGLFPRDSESYTVDLRFSLPGSEVDVVPTRQLPLVEFDQVKLQALEYDAAAYGQQLSAMLFTEPARAVFDAARASADTAGAPLRLHLRIDPRASELHRLRWETLRDPQTGGLLLASETVLFSRYFTSLDWRPVRLRPKGDLHALVVIANPANLAEYQLAPIDVAGERQRAEASLGGFVLTVLDGATAETRATPDNLQTKLREDVDLLYLVCHGTVIKNEPWLWLEEADGRVKREKGGDWVARLHDLRALPRLVVLASCQSAAAGTGVEGALAGLGPRLAEAGVPAVLAMQGNISTDTVKDFMPRLFEELQKDGQIDRAVAVARGLVRDRPDWWMPALFMRLRSGRLWYAAGFADDPRLKKWESLIDSLKHGQCTPFLGPGLLNPYFGLRREIAWTLAEAHCYPLAPHEREDLPLVAQYLTIEQDEMHLWRQFSAALEAHLRARHALPGATGDTGGDNATLNTLLTQAGAAARRSHPAEGHGVLADLNCPLYISANPDTLLAEALRERGKQPEQAVYPWNDAAAALDSVYLREPDYRPTKERPLIYYLFGQLADPFSLVLTEDHYFDYLIGLTRNFSRVPKSVRAALVNSALLFLGFQSSDWSFRVIFRTILMQEGSSQLKRYSHVTAQIDPEEGRVLEPKRARKYLEDYFLDQTAKTSVFWGSAEDFAAELQRRMKGGA